MKENVDLRRWLEKWPYDPEDNVRKVRAEDGRQVLQVRLPMGIEQYELEGRPDAQRPHGKESVFEYYIERLAEAKAAGREEAFGLSEEQCAELFNEGTLYYQRYIHCFQARDWSRTVRDTSRNLRLFDFVHRYAEREEDQLYLEQWRPYILRINAAASAMLALERDDPDQALAIVQTTVEKITALPDMDDSTFQFERKRSLMALREMAAQIEQTKPVSELEGLQTEMQQAVEAQDFEQAAVLRDRIRALRNKPSRAAGN